MYLITRRPNQCSPKKEGIKEKKVFLNNNPNINI